MMMEIMEYSMIEMVDPTGILSGHRYEFRIYVKFEEEDELYTKQGTGVRVLYVVDEETEKVASYYLFDRATDEVLDFELDEEEQLAIAEFCKEHLGD